ncbi:unnamed protein product [Phytomonas sp. EM1]|nr:unnamed protein product [Phytomonas sp. EM1]|eukprot:CCW61443.1 unnamed protein product [Phytomonas sp. isolate EM1]
MVFKIYRVELENFKSYAGKVRIGPFKDFTCIVGPNGAGKSNLMDALSFVLSSTSLDTTHNKHRLDFINHKSKKGCVVTIVLRQTEEANTSVGSHQHQHTLGSAISEVSFTRSVTRAGMERFAINHKEVSEECFSEQLKAHRVGSRVNTFLVFQHEVETIARMKGKELTELFDQVSGSGELKQEYNSRKKALEMANNGLLSASIEKRGAIVAANQMRIAMKEAEHFEELRRSYEEGRRDLALTELFEVELELEKQKDELDRFNKTLLQLQKGVTTEKELRDMKRRYAEKHRTYLEELRTNRKLADDLRTRATLTDRAKATLTHLGRKYELQKSELTSLLKVDAVHSNEMKRLRDELQRQQTVLDNFEKACAKEDEENTLVRGSISEEHMSEYRRLRKEADCETVTLRQHAETVRRQHDSIREALRQCQMMRETLELQRKDLELNKERATVTRGQLQQRANDLAESNITLEKQMDETRKALKMTQKKSTEREIELAKIQEQLHELYYMKDTSKHQHRMGEALQALRSLFPIRGRLVDLCSIPNTRYRNATTVAMGKNLEAVIVNTSDIAISCVSYLKEHRMPPMTFLPLDSVQGDVVDDRLRTLGGTCKPLIDIVQYETEIEPAVRFALGQILVCDSMAEAKKVAYGSSDGKRFKVVTLDGTMLLKNGVVQGGLAAIQMRANKWDEKKYSDLRSAYERLLNGATGGSEAELARAHIAIRDMESRLQFTQKRIQVVNGEKDAIEAKLKSLGNEIQKLSETAQSLEERERYLKQELEGVSKEMLKTSQAIAKAEGRVFSEFQNKANILTILQYEDKHAELEKQRAEYRRQLQLLIHKLEQAIEVEKNRLNDHLLANKKEACERLVKEMAECEKDFTAHQNDFAAAEKLYERAKLAALKSSEDLGAMANEIRQVTASSETMLNRLAHARKGATALQAACNTLRLRRVNIMQRCQMDGIELPLKMEVGIDFKRARPEDGTRGDSKGRVQHLMQSELFTPLTSSPGNQNFSSTGDSEVKVYIDFSGLSSALRDIAADRSSFSSYKQRMEASIEKISIEMQALAPNIRATSLHVASADRLGASSTVLEAAREQVRKAHAEFLQVKEMRTGRFMEAFGKIAASVDRIYRELTLGTQTHGVHGSAYLSLENVEEPYLGSTTYHATPPLKHFMPMELLSGGERTMAALALLFAIHDVSATPFFILDEVDAALDAVNVEKLANFLRNNCFTCQFVVVSLKDQLYHMADFLIGVLKDKEKGTSKVLTMDLGGFPY